MTTTMMTQQSPDAKNISMTSPSSRWSSSSKTEPTTLETVLKEVKTQLSKVQAWEEQIKQAASTLSEEQEEENVTHKNAMAIQHILERYQQSRSLYLHRRLKHALCDHTSSFNGKTFTYPIDYRKEDGDDTATHSTALEELNSSMIALANNCRKLQEETYPAVQQERAALERLVQQLVLEQEKAHEIGIDDGDAADMGDENEPPPDAVIATLDDLRAGQEKLDALERRKQELRQKLDAVQEQERQARAHCLARKEELDRLKQNNKSDNDSTMEDSNEEDEEEEQQLQKQRLDHVLEIKQYYDAMRQVMEELGGFKIIDTTEQESDRHLILIVELYDKYRIQIDLEPLRRQKEFKLFHAKWLAVGEGGSDRVVVYAQQQPASEPLSLMVPSLDDLVQVANMTLCPGEDLKFLLRESLYRIRVFQNRVNELDSLRRRVLTKTVGESGDQVVCSFNEGILVCLRLHECHVTVEQVIGVGGWDAQVIEQLQQQLQDFVIHRDTSHPRHRSDGSVAVVTPSLLVDKIQSQIEMWKQEGTITFPKTPRMPHKQNEPQGFF